jgi:glucose-1-phosphate thymidylyltransferase
VKISTQQKSPQWKGLLLAGGAGTRLYPSSKAINKHLLNVYDKPLIYYSLTTLMLSGVDDIIVVTSETSVNSIKHLLGDGTQWGIKINYCIQPAPNGVAGAINSAAKMLRGFNIALALGDNILFGAGLSKFLNEARLKNKGATIFGYSVKDPSQFGVVTIDAEDNAVGLEEKPHKSKSKLAVPGLYFFDDRLAKLTRELKPSARGELEITDVNKSYLESKTLKVCRMGRGIAWLDAGTTQDLFEAGQFVKVIEERTGTKIGCPEEVAFRQKWISESKFEQLVDVYPISPYREYLQSLSR